MPIQINEAPVFHAENSTAWGVSTMTEELAANRSFYRTSMTPGFVYGVIMVANLRCHNRGLGSLFLIQVEINLFKVLPSGFSNLSIALQRFRLSVWYRVTSRG